MSVHAMAHQATVVTGSPFNPAVGNAPLRRAAGLAGDVLLLGALIFCIPFVILAIGLPVVLFVQLLLWIARLF